MTIKARDNKFIQWVDRCTDVWHEGVLGIRNYYIRPRTTCDVGQMLIKMSFDCIFVICLWLVLSSIVMGLLWEIMAVLTNNWDAFWCMDHQDFQPLIMINVMAILGNAFVGACILICLLCAFTEIGSYLGVTVTASEVYQGFKDKYCPRIDWS